MTSQDKNDKEEKKILVVNRSKTSQKDDNTKGSKDDKIVVVDNKPQNLAPLSGPGFGEDDSAKKKSDSQVVVKSNEPKELAPLGNVNAIMGTGDESTKSNGDKKKEMSSDKKKDENVSDLHEKSSISDKGKGKAMAAGAATGAVAAKTHSAVSDNKDTDLSNKHGDKKIADEKKASDNKLDEKKASDNKLDEKKASDNKLDEKKASDNKLDEKKASDNKLDEKKASDNKLDEKKASDNKLDEKKASDNKSDEKKSLGDKIKQHGAAVAAGAGAVAGAVAAKAHSAVSGNKDKKPSANDTGKQNQPVANDSKYQGEKDNHTALKAGSGAAAVGGATYAISKGGSDKNNHVSIDEKKNESIPISKNENDAPEKLEDPDESSVLHNLRKENKILAEGFVYKKRPWLFCFWVKKYFILLRTGELSFIEVDGTGEPQNDWNIRKASAFNKIDYPEYSYPYRFTFACDSADGYLSFDTMKDRDYWYDSLQDISRSN